MLKKEALLGVLLVFLLVGVSFVSAELVGEAEAIEKGYDCLADTVDSRTCNQLSLESQIFSLLTVGKCKDEVLAQASGDNMCWPKQKCNLKDTALATLALENLGINTNNSEAWMLSQEGVPTDIDWFLEIDSEGATTCSISHGESRAYTAQIAEDKTVSIDVSTCLKPSTALGGYWFEIVKECYDREFEISCDQDFLTTLLFKKPDSSTIYVLDKVHPELAGGSTTESIDSSCFTDGNYCDYEGSLWASMVLDFLNYDVTPFIPYLTTAKSENPEFLPESFLYHLTNLLEFKTDLLLKQMSQQYWNVGGGKFYDTALALLPFKSEFIQEKENSKEWLIDIQEDSGCWNNDHVRDTAFILYSIWDESGSGGTPDPTCNELGYDCVANSTVCDGNVLGYECSAAEVCCDGSGSNSTNNTVTCLSAGYDCTNDSSLCVGDFFDYECSSNDFCCELEDLTGIDDNNCEDEGFYCMSGINCEGEILYEFDCPSLQKCCDTPKVEKTCNDLDGIVCNVNQYCSQGESVDSDELAFRETCCVGGSCELLQTGGGGNDDDYTCEINFGVCEPFECDSGYVESYQYDCEFGDICCVQDSDSTGKKKSYWWVWLLFILIVLITLLILYKDKVQEFILKVKNKGSGDEFSPRGDLPPRFPPSYPKRPMRPMPRKILPPSGNPIQGPNTQQRISASVRPMIKKPDSKKSPEELSDVLKKLKDMSR